MNRWIDSLRDNRHLPAEGYRDILLCEDSGTNEYLREEAQRIAQQSFGRDIFIRGLIEITNICRNDCLYCGIRRSNTVVKRYSLSKQTIMECCKEGYRLGIRTFVLQGGENPAMTDSFLVDVVAQIRREYPDCAITLSLGEKSYEEYKRLFDAGANRYLLRHETANKHHYSLLHPSEMSFDNRVQCLEWLKQIGYQTGTGIMVGSPHQTIDNLVEDILFIEQFQPQMIGIGPFIPHNCTPFGDQKAGSIEMTLKLISIFRLIAPSALIPSTTALATLSPQGRELGILSGANVVMPNLSPLTDRANYALYNNKAYSGAEASEGLALLERQLNNIGYKISFERGDFSK